MLMEETCERQGGKGGKSLTQRREDVEERVRNEQVDEATAGDGGTMVMVMVDVEERPV